MRTAVGISLLVIGLVIGIAGSAVLSLGTVLRPSTVGTTSVSTIFSTTVITYIATIQATISSESAPVAQGLSSTLSISSSIGSQPSTSPAIQATSVSSSTYSATLVTNSGSSILSTVSNVTISGPVIVNNGTPYQVVLTGQSGVQYVISVQGGQEISTSVPNNETYSVVIYFYIIGGGSSSCNAQSLSVYSTLSVYAVDISCQ